MPNVKYELEPNTARDITYIFCAANHNIILTPASITPTQTPAPDTSTHTVTASSNITHLAALSSIASGTTTHTLATSIGTSGTTPHTKPAKTNAISRFVSDTTKHAKRKAFAEGNKTLEDAANQTNANIVYSYLTNELLTTPLHLTDSTEHGIPRDKARAGKLRGSITVKHLDNLLKSDSVCLSLHIKQEILLATDMIITAGLGGMKLSPEFIFEDQDF